MTIIRAMDRSLKARLIGASLLVLVVVLVVPELLSGRKAATTETPGAADTTLNNGPTRTYTIELGEAGSAAAADANLPRPYMPESSPLAAERPARAQASPSDRDDTAAARPPVASTAAREVAAPRGTKPATAGSERGSGRTDTVAGTASAPAEAEPPTASGNAGPSRGTWSVQVGAFGSAASARKLVEQLEADGFAAYVSAVARNGKSLHRVRVGPESARAAADALAGRLKARGLPVSLVAND
jgi:cell division septation protein DedD